MTPLFFKARVVSNESPVLKGLNGKKWLLSFARPGWKEITSQLGKAWVLICKTWVAGNDSPVLEGLGGKK